MGSLIFRTAVLAIAWVAATSTNALAIDGVIEINHAKALRGGVTPTDTAGYPVTIGEPGSYRLTGNLTVPDEDTNGVFITADDVTLDFNGFALTGPTVCTKTTHVFCTPTGTGIGVLIAEAAGSATVKRGTIQGMGFRGIDTSSASSADGMTRVDDMRISSNGSDGVRLGPASIVTGSSIVLNGDNGVVGQQFSVFVENIAGDNGDEGFDLEAASYAAGNIARENAAGFTALAQGSGATVFIGNVSAFNSGGSGMNTNIRALFAENVSADNDGAGIIVTTAGDALFYLNNLYDNGGVGLSAQSSAGYAANGINVNNGGSLNPQVVGAPTQLDTNMCGGNTACP